MRKSLLFIFLSSVMLLSACGGSDGPTAKDVVNSFDEAGLAVPNSRDNTEQNCPDLNCEHLQTTDTVSVYEWSDIETAEKNSEYFDYQNGKFTIMFNDKDISETDKQAYIDALDKFLKNNN